MFTILNCFQSQQGEETASHDVRTLDNGDSAANDVLGDLKLDRNTEEMDEVSLY